MSTKNLKFKVGDVIVRKAYKDEKSAFFRDEMTIREITSDEHPICAQMWYVCEDCRGRVRPGLAKMMDDAFILKS